MRRLLPLMLLLAAALPAQAQGVKRCTDAQGNTVFTDRPCASVDAVPKGAPAPAPGAYAPGFAPRGCARTAEALLAGVRTALEARDVNRLASYYHWAGTGTRGALQVMDELEAIANRPLVAVSLDYPVQAPLLADPRVAADPGSGSEPDPATGLPSPASAASAGTGAGSEPDPVPADPVPAAAPGSAPTGLAVEQMAGPADAGSRSTRFRLQRHVDCWWLEL